MADPDDIVLGIDLGTTFSAMAIVNKHGKPEIVANAEGHPTTPSVVHFYDDSGVVVGDEAVKMVVIDPGNVVRFIKRHMGEEDFTLEFYGRSYTPQEISALVLRKLKEDSEDLLGCEVKDAVITVPAYFNSAQRGATSEAGTIAGLNVLSIINEPTAAAIAYGLDRIGGRRKLLVFDLGGGTFDVTVMEIKGTKLTTIASDGNAELGGKDWDDRLLNYVAEQFVAKYQLDPRDDPAPYQELYERVLHAKISLSTKDRAVIPVNYHGQRMVVNVDRPLFEHLSADLLQQCADTANIVLDKAGVKWPELDDVLLVGGSTRMPMVRELLKRLSNKEAAEGVNPDECVAIGAALAGVFRHRPNHPALRAKRQAMADRARETAAEGRAPSAEPPPPPAPGPRVIGAAPQHQQTTPERRGALAIGLADGGHVAAQAQCNTGVSQPPFANVQDDVSQLPEVTIEDATTHPLGVIVLDKKRQEVVHQLIREGTKVPHEYRDRFGYAFDNMTAVRVEVTEGTGQRRDEVAVIGKVELTGLPPRKRGDPIEVVYRYGVDQILQVQVIDVTSGKSGEVRIRFRGGLTPEQVAEARGRNANINVD